MNNMLMRLMLVVVAFAGQNAMAEETLLDHVIDACGSDIDNYCSKVTPGDGRLLYCMAAHEDKISGECQYAFFEAAALLQQLSMAIAYFAQECETEIDTLCSDVVAGDGRLLSCLDAHEEEVGDSCKQAVVDTVGE